MSCLHNGVSKDAFDLFESPAALITWAYEDTERFKEVEDDFFGPQAYEKIVEFDAEVGADAHRIRFIQSPPPELRKLASHIVNDLRHSLDQAFSIAAKFFGWEATKKKSVLYFPWATDVADLKNRLWDIPLKIHDIIFAHQPYGSREGSAGGSYIIRELGRIAGPNKHEAALEAFAGASMKSLNVDWNGDWLIPYPETMWDSASQQLTYGYFPPNSEGNYDIEIALFMTFRDIPTLSGIPARNLFHAWGGFTESVVAALEKRVAEAL